MIGKYILFFDKNGWRRRESNVFFYNFWLEMENEI